MPTDYRDKLDALLTGTLSARDFRHHDLIGVAFEAFCEDEFFRAATQVAGGVRALAMRAGRPSLFHATITWAMLSLVAERMQAASYRGPEDFIARNPDLADRSVLSRWYSDARLKSPVARSVALMPDRVGKALDTV